MIHTALGLLLCLGAARAECIDFDAALQSFDGSPLAAPAFTGNFVCPLGYETIETDSEVQCEALFKAHDSTTGGLPLTFAYESPGGSTSTCLICLSSDESKIFPIATFLWGTECPTPSLDDISFGFLNLDLKPALRNWCCRSQEAPEEPTLDVCASGYDFASQVTPAPTSGSGLSLSFLTWFSETSSGYVESTDGDPVCPSDFNLVGRDDCAKLSADASPGSYFSYFLDLEPQDGGGCFYCIMIGTTLNLIFLWGDKDLDEKALEDLGCTTQFPLGGVPTKGPLCCEAAPTPAPSLAPTTEPSASTDTRTAACAAACAKKRLRAPLFGDFSECNCNTNA
mmetsp:Transcript_27322/g.81960  ORF Transcript_27322/g.81960 Transcript_27322/m.81960 type:complete len:339 (-) Transcript_27322:43-1059(-)|eukprot:CAMPEP_0119278646 /NCGR_PEP_ID=MMETSP1329-20130426/19446_1 /TAXON_ID=114041 /ORGANISM="Genus nov. species nov., Strain RCC1024" /LENGTH=338 /DNA_ID=CAMNT_0007279163 /DNA_START=182 /DNA_END=1198 /DNA_ORIENTATION=+